MLLAFAGAVSLARPWIGVVAGYGIALLTPQAVWYWNFDGVRPAFWVLMPTLLGFAFALGRGDHQVSALKSPRNAYLLVLWVCFTISYYFGPYTNAGGPYRFTDPAWALSTLNKVFILYFVASICIDEEHRLKALMWTFLVSLIYLTYWANDRYLSGMVMGRLAGPTDVFGIGTYGDENTFALLFVVGQAYLWYLGQVESRKWLRWGMWLVIPFSWHAVFLTASRGALVGIGVTTLLMALRSKRKALGLLLIPAFAAAYFWQAGDLMKSRAETIGDYQTETSASTRLEAWAAARAMMAHYPITGVGLASFGPAFPDYSDKKPREAHNTFFQIAAESGILAGSMYVLLITSSILALWRNSRVLRDRIGTNNYLYHVNEGTLVSVCGLAICALFLSLQMFEIVYFLLLVTHAVLLISKKAIASAGAPATAPQAPEPIKYGVRRTVKPGASRSSNAATAHTSTPNTANRSTPS